MKTCTSTDECTCVHTYDICDTRYTKCSCGVLVLVISKEKNAKIQTYSSFNLGSFQNAPDETWTISLLSRFLKKKVRHSC